MMSLWEAYTCLGVNEETPISEVKDIYESYITRYKQMAKTEIYYHQKLMQYKEAYECLLMNQDMSSLSKNKSKKSIILSDSCVMDEQPAIKVAWREPKSFNPPKKFGCYSFIMTLMAIFLALEVIRNLDYARDELFMLRSQEPIGWSEVDKGLDVLSNQFELKLSKFNANANWDWAYFEDYGGYWYIALPIEVVKTDERGALVHLVNFKLEDEAGTAFFTENLYTDKELSGIHFLGEFEELIPVNEIFGIVFYVPALADGEKRGLYYEYPNGRRQKIGSIYYHETQDSSNPPINFNIVMHEEQINDIMF